MSERSDPIDRLSVFDRVEAPDQWDEIVARAREAEPAELRVVGAATGRSRWMLAAAAAALLVSGAGVLLLAGVGDGDIAPATLPSTAPTSSVPGTPAPTTVAAPVSDASTPPSSIPGTAAPTTPPVTEQTAAAPRLTSSCPGAEITGNDTISGGGGFETFGRLGDEPSLVLTMPQGPDGGTLIQTGSIARDIERIPGGQVLLMQPDETDTAWQLIAIDDEGSIRWRRCGSRLAFELYASPVGDAVHVREGAFDEVPAWRSFDVVSGADVTPLAVDPAAALLDADHDFVLLEPVEGLRLVDLATGTVTDVPLPEFDGEFTAYTLDGVDGTVPVIVAREEQSGPALGVFVAGAWRTDRDTLLATVELTVVENSIEFGGAELGNGVWARDPLGATVWIRPIVNGIRGEGWATGVVGDVILTNECRADDPTKSYGCGDPWHIALDLVTGELLWERQGFVGVGPAGDGAALIADEDGWSVVALRTGEVLQDRSDRFSTECCGLDTFVWAGGDGGVVWAVENETIRIYYPEVVSVPTVEVDLTR